MGGQPNPTGLACLMHPTRKLIIQTQLAVNQCQRAPDQTTRTGGGGGGSTVFGPIRAPFEAL